MSARRVGVASAVAGAVGALALGSADVDPETLVALASQGLSGATVALGALIAWRLARIEAALDAMGARQASLEARVSSVEASAAPKARGAGLILPMGVDAP